VKFKLPGDYTVRDAKNKIDTKRVRAVIRAIEEFAAPLVSGNMPIIPGADAPLTLEQGFELALDLTDGKYPMKTPRWQEVNRARTKLERILGKRRPWVEVRPGDARRVWRTLAQEYAAAQHKEGLCGPRQAEVTVDALYSVAGWLRDEDRLPSDAVPAMGRWRAKLKAEWQEITDEEVRPIRPRHSEHELCLLFKHVHHADVDPRFALAFDLGGEQRLGQVLRARRRDLELPLRVADRTGDDLVGHVGQIRIRGVGKKTTQVIVLSSEQRDAVEAAFAGYLADYEAHWRAGDVDDYLLFPSGRFKHGKAKVQADPTHLTRDAALGMFHDLERIAGVTAMKGRGWYGVRRRATDLAEDQETDERVLNSITGHRNSDTRRLVYQESERPEVLARAAITRSRVRRGRPDAPASEPMATTAR
jgi:integrase